MKVNVEGKNGISVCRVVGDIDINSSPEVKKFFDKMPKEQKTKVLISLKEVGYVDSSGLATIVEVFKTLRSSGGKLKLCGLSTKVRGLFEITKLDKLFDISATEEDALGSF